MRKLSYEIFNRQGEKINEVSTYKELEQEKAKGNSFKCKLTEIKERWVFEIYKGKEFIKETTLNKEKALAKEQGYTVKAVLRTF